MINFDNYELSGISYGGHGGSKKGIYIDNERWFLKYPKSTKSMKNVDVSYVNSPLCEYIGSHIYELLDIDCHKTMLGISDNKLVVACKDFLNDYEILLDYNIIKNNYDKNQEKEIDSLSSKSVPTLYDIEEIKIVMNNNLYFGKLPELRDRFWDMFVIDAFINNNDRNEGNWGIIIDKSNRKIRISPVFDNGESFYNKISEEKALILLNDEEKLHQLAYENAASVFSNNGKMINPLKFIESMSNAELNAAIKRIVPKINMEKIKRIIDDIPNSCNDIDIISDYKKELYYKMLEIHYYYVLLPIFNNLINNNI